MPRKVLVVEDERHIMRLIQVHLQRAGFEVVRAFNAEKAFEAMEREQPDLLIIDQTLPDRAGNELARMLRHRPSDKKFAIVMMFPKGINAEWVEGWIGPSDCFITKPFNPTELVAFGKRALEGIGKKADAEEELVLVPEEHSKSRRLSWSTVSKKSIFRYLHDPRECLHTDYPAACVICKQVRPGYGLIQRYEHGYDEYQVCETCLVSGRLAERGLRVNEGDVDALAEQLRLRSPDMGEQERRALILERTTELEQRTPYPTVLKLSLWPAHCADYAIYFRRVFADDLNLLAPDGDGKAFLASHLYDAADLTWDFVDGVWEERLQGFYRFYLWQCSECADYLLTYDCD